MSREIKPPVTKTMTFLMLSDDLVLHCLARVSRLYYPTLSLVCKRFRSLVTSLEIYETRTLLGCTKTCLYVFLQVPSDSTTRWFTLSRKPNPNPNPRWFTPFFAPYRFLKNRYTEKEKNHLISVPTRNSPVLVDWWGLVTIGYNIYKIGTGMISSRVIFMDCRSNTWREAPSMRFTRVYPSVCVLDGKIYVAGGRKDLNGSNWMECFNPEACEWEHVPSPGAEVSGNYEHKWLAIEGKLYVFWKNGRTVVYKPKENRWEEVGVDSMEVPLAWVPGSSCVIDNVLYCYRWSDKLKWYDFEGRTWRVLKGLEKLYKLSKDNGCVRMVDYGGKIAVLWKNYDEDEENMIWCAEITIERRNNHEIYGKVEWCNVVLTVPKSCSVMKLLSVTL